jgi:signal transduction histidine kinase
VSVLMADHDRRHHDAYMQHHLDTGEARVIGKVREMQARAQGRPGVSDQPGGIAHRAPGPDDLHRPDPDITERNRAAEALEEKSRQLRTLSRRVLEAQEMERRRVAHELHDELGQSLTAIKINLQARERFKDRSATELNAENLRIVEDALQHVRRLAVALRPSVLDDLGLIPALRGIAQQTGTRSGFEVHFQPAIPDHAAAAGCRDRVLPCRAGGADQHHAARPRAARRHPPVP